ncbi:MAG TPA: tetratricopeptide repeat protein [Polyangiaceae bacterium]|nr:tetratricopeptide repeat protein [Polyangiaceae bacterium]
MTDRVSLMPPAGLGVAERRAMLVGRAAEMRELEGALQDVVKRGVCRTVTLVGAAGVGKTRLVRDFLLRMRSGGGPAPRVFRGSARDQGPAYGVFARVLRARFGIVEGMDPEAAKAQIRAQVAAVLEDRKVGDVVYFLGQLLELKFLDSPLIKAVEGDPQQLRQLRRAVIKRFLEADAMYAPEPTASQVTAPSTTGQASAAARGPIVLVFDDLHFAHEDSLDLLAYLIEYVSAPVLILCLARPEMLVRHDGWAKHGGDRHHLLELSPLSDTDASAVMQDLLAPCGDDEAVEDLIDAACTLAGGNPALLEQMVRIFHDMGVLEVEDELAEDERWKVHVEKLAHVKLPITVQDAVQARIAALAPAERELLERAATMGAVFWVGGLLATQRWEAPPPEVWHEGESVDRARVQELLGELRERDYVLRLPDSTFPGDEEYVFKHNLERETLLKLTPPGTARRYHASVADWLASKDSIRGHEESLGMLAHHREAAGHRTQAAQAYLDAADVARSQYANGKAAEYYKRGLDLVSAGAEVDVDKRIRALHHYGDVLQLLGKNDEALSAFREMMAVAYRLDMRTRGGAAHGRIGRLYRDTGRLERAEQHLGAALKLFEQERDERGIASTVDDIGKLYWLKGDYAKALEHTQRALAMRRRLGDRRSIALSLNNMGLVYQDSGHFKEALDAFEQALTIRREIGDLVGVAISLNNLGTVAQDQRDDQKALGLFREAYEVAKETGDRNRIALVLTNLGETLNRLGDPQKAIKHLKQAEDLADELGDKLGLAEAVRGLGKAYLAQREYTKARECTARAVEIFREIQSKVQLGVALRSLGEVTAAGSAGGEGLKSAREYLQQSMQIFEEAGNEVEQARSFRAYAELLRGTMEHRTDPAVQQEADSYARRADDIFAKLKLSAYGLGLT